MKLMAIQLQVNIHVVKYMLKYKVRSNINEENILQQDILGLGVEWGQQINFNFKFLAGYFNLF